MSVSPRWLASLTLILVLSGFSFFSFGQFPTEKFVISDIIFKGNKKTKDHIIQRELTFRKGDTLVMEELIDALEKSTENLQRLPLFHFVKTQVDDTLSNEGVTVTIDVSERWYTWLWPIFEISDRNFNSWLENGDLTRLSYGLFLQQENFRGRLEKLHIRAKMGYQQQISLLYEAPYLNRSKTLGAGLQISAARERETGYITESDKLVYYRADKFLRRTNEIAVFARYRPQIHISHTLKLQLTQYNFSDTLINLNPDYSGIADKKTNIPVVGYLMKADFRDRRGYPLKGWYADAEIDGFGLTQKADYNFATLRASARVHIPLTARWNTAFGVATKLSTSGLKPWFLNQALGYKRDYVRGYEYNVIDGDHFWLVKTNVRYAIVPENILKVNRIKAGQFNTIPYAFYLGLFADAGQVWPGQENTSNSLPGKILAGTGIGLDFVTYYDKVLRAEFSMNSEGKAGFSLHFMAAI